MAVDKNLKKQLEAEFDKAYGKGQPIPDKDAKALAAKVAGMKVKLKAPKK